MGHSMSNQSLKTSPDSNFYEIYYICWPMQDYEEKNIKKNLGQVLVKI